MTSQDKVQRLKALAQRAGNLEFEAYMDFNRERAIHFLRKMNRFTQLAIQAQHGA